MFERTKPNLNARSLDMHRLIADKIRNDPAQMERVRSTLKRWLSIVDGRSLPYLMEWQRLLDAGIDECLKVATEDSEHAATLRQSSPFCGILTEQERLEFLDTWRPRP